MLQIENLGVRANNKEILKNLSLSVPTGELHVLMGPNGSGKSTLAQTLAGHRDYTITEGSVQIEKKDITDLSPEEKAHHGLFVAFQNPVPIPGVTVGTVLRTALTEQQKARGETQITLETFLEKALAICKQLRIPPETLERSFNEGFSGGERKKGEVLQLLMLEPKVVVLDETDSGLDIDALKLITETVQQLRTPNRSWLVITHYPHLVDALKPDRVHILQKGLVVKSGDVSISEAVAASGFAKENEKA